MKTAFRAVIAFSFLILTCSAAFACGGDKHMSGGESSSHGEGSAAHGD